MMKTRLFMALAGCAVAQLLHAQEPTPGVVRSRPAPPVRPSVSVPAPAVAAPQVRPQASIAPNLRGPHGLGIGNSNTSRPVPNSYVPRRYQPTGTPSVYHNANRPANSVTTGVAPRVGTIPRQQNTDVASGTREWNGRPRTWNSPSNANTGVATNNSNAGNKSNANNWRTRNPNNYTSWQDARRHYDHHRHDRDWGRRHHDRIILVNGGYYFWDAGWWYPAWGYDAAAQSYAYDGPIYGYDGLPPDQVIAQVQTALQQQGYYEGMIDGEFGTMTQQALIAWQRDHGLAITTAIDYPTLASLGLA